VSLPSVAAGLLLASLIAACGAAAVGAARALRHDRLLRRRASAAFRSAAPTPYPPGRSLPAGVVAPHSVRGSRRLRSVLTAPARRRRDIEVSRSLPAAVEGIARSLRAGGSVRTALADAAAAAPATLSHDLGVVVRASDHGIPLRQALERWADQRPLPGVRLTEAALVLGVDAGAGLARSLDGVAATLYERAAIGREVRALSTQARYSAGVLAIAPLGFLAVVGFLEPAAVSFLVATPAGVACLAAGLALDATGGWWMARITRRAS
jgi:tight adherence protein B